jgi:peptide chain release factor 1
MQRKLEKMFQRYEEIGRLVSDPETIRDQKRYKELMQEHAALADIAAEYTRRRQVEAEIAGARDLIESGEGSELRELAREELKDLEKRREAIDQRLRVLLVPRDPLDLKNIIMEIRAGTGGEEAALFAADLFRMYVRYAEDRRWKAEILSAHETEIGGFKEIIFSVTGKSVYENLRYESGVHRVQRVPVTETGGRIHTSAVTVAVLPEAEETDVDIRPEDLRIDVYRSSGPGGQSVNTTDSAVRITYLPTGMVVTCQDEKSQHKNKAKALRVLRARVYEQEESKRQEERARARKSQVGSGDRSERIRTYNFPQNRVTDHRIGLTLYRLEAVLLGALEEVIEPLKLSAREEYLKTQAS